MESTDPNCLITQEEFDVESQTSTSDKKYSKCEMCCEIFGLILVNIVFWGGLASALGGFIYGIVKMAKEPNFHVRDEDLIKCIVTNEKINDSTEAFINITRYCLLELTSKARNKLATK